MTLDLNDPDDAREYLAAHGSRWADIIPDQDALTLVYQHFIWGDVPDGDPLPRRTLN